MGHRGTAWLAGCACVPEGWRRMRAVPEGPSTCAGASSRPRCSPGRLSACPHWHLCRPEGRITMAAIIQRWCTVRAQRCRGIFGETLTLTQSLRVSGYSLCPLMLKGKCRPIQIPITTSDDLIVAANNSLCHLHQDLVCGSGAEAMRGGMSCTWPLNCVGCSKRAAAAA